MKAASLLVTEKSLADPEISALVKRSGTPVVLSESLFKVIADAETPQGIAAEIEVPQSKDISTGDCVFLEGVFNTVS